MNKTSYITIHENNQMIHDFGNGYKIIVDWSLGKAFKTKDGEKIEEFSTNISLKDYEEILINFSKAIQ